MERMQNFADYLYWLLPSALKLIGKKANQWWILCRVLGRRFDDLKAAALDVRGMTMILACTDDLLPLFGRERNMPRLQGEIIDQHRRRLSAKRLIAEQAGTTVGLLALMRSFGYLDTRLEPLYLTDLSRWAEATLWINSGSLLLLDRGILQEQINIIKPASALISIGHELTTDGNIYFGVCMETFKIIEMEE